MARRRRIAGKPRRSNFGRRRKSHKGASISVKQNYASCVETIEFEDISGNVVYYNQFDLDQFSRAKQIASQYAYFRPKLVEWSYDPFYDTYQDAAGGVATVPQLMWIMNRTGQFNLTSKAQLEDMGAMPRKWTKNLTIKYKPNTLSLVANPSNVVQGSDNTIIKYAGVASSVNKWIAYQSTDSSGNTVLNAAYTPFFGHMLLAEQVATTAQNLGRIRCRVHWEFKEPLTVPIPALQLKAVRHALKNV